jgi:Flp pilus assembly protein TadD
MNIRVGAWVLVLLWVCCIAPPFSSILAGEPQWVEVRSPHFSVVTDAGEKRGREAAMRFEQMRAVFGTLLVKAKVNLPVPLQIVALRNSKEVEQFAPMWNGKPTKVTGLFQGNSDRCFIILDMSAEDPWKVVFHEYAHQLMNGNVAGRTDAWFEEGFAEYFSSIEVDGKQARVGKIPANDYEMVRSGGMLKIADLFRVKQDSRIYNDNNDRRAMFYIESSMVVHYLYDNLLIPKLSTYFELAIDKKVPVEDAIQQSFGMSAQEFDMVLRGYINSGRYRYYPIAAPASLVSSDFASAFLTSVDANAILADVHLHSRDYQPKALEEFQQILQTSPTHPGALRGMGYAYLGKRDFDHAADFFRRASQADSKDPRVHYYSALLMNRQEPVIHDRDQLDVMKQELQTAIALDPNFADSYSLLAYAYVSGGESDKALEAMRKAVELSPRNEEYLYNLAMMYLSAQNADPAIRLLSYLQNSTSPEVAARARQSLAEAESYKAALGSGSGTAIGQGPRPGRMVVLDHRDAHGPQVNEVSKTGADIESGQSAARDSGPPAFLKGQIKGVDCSTPPTATLNVLSENRTYKLSVADINHVILIGVDKFSCAWTNQKVAINYRESADGQSRVMSVEIQ